MKIALAIITKNEELMLKKTLPTLDFFDYKYAVDHYSTDKTPEILNSHNFKVYPRKWTNSYSEARNDLIKILEGEGMEAVVMLDADESIFEASLSKIIEDLQKNNAILTPRVNFVKNFSFYAPYWDPDYQCRIFNLNRGYKFTSNVHEALTDRDNIFFVYQNQVCKKNDDIIIYHYGYTKKDLETSLKAYNYKLLAEGKPTVDNLPETEKIKKISMKGLKRYKLSHPLS